MKIVILYSGGLDSLILNHYAKTAYPEAQIVKLYYSHGADSENSEIKSLPKDVVIKHVDWLDQDNPPVSKISDPFAGAIYIPGRNLIFASLAACQYLPDEVWMGTLWDEDHHDATDKSTFFANSTSKLLRYVLSPFLKEDIKIRFPFSENGWTKFDCVKWALENGLTKQQLISTISCWHHDGQPCGECKQCFKRHLFFTLNGIEEVCKTHPFKNESGKALTELYMTKRIQNPQQMNRDEQTVCGLIDKYIVKMNYS